MFMFDRGINEEINDLLGRELQGKLNEALLLILLTNNFSAAMKSKEEIQEPFKKRKSPIIEEGLTTRVIADELDMPQSTVATAVARLVKRGYVTHSKGMPVKTTEIGRQVGEEKLRHHRLIEVYLVNGLGIDHDLAHDESLKLMLLASCDLIVAIDEHYNHPTICPCGHAIPQSPLCDRIKK
ncbi:MAG: metal-dependent transcriptional regulator [Candidatus Heimdallarchaeota archaeon]|nr:metal-dependent transcriptional regulator [Candidatus Heimdallarchaeota archaeon]